MKVWFEDFKQLIDSKNVTQFWPNNRQTPEERVNAASRFVIYTTCVLYLIRRDVRIFVLGGMVLAVLYVMYKSGMIQDTMMSAAQSYGGYGGCQRPSSDNPMANKLMLDDSDGNPACFFPNVRNDVKQYLDASITYDSGRSRTSDPIYQRNSMARQFTSTANSTLVNDQDGFAQWAYGTKNCKSEGGVYCNPDARGVQLEAYGGLDTNYDTRGGTYAYAYV